MIVLQMVPKKLQLISGSTASNQYVSMVEQKIAGAFKYRTHNNDNFVSPHHEGLASCIKYIDNRPGQFGYNSIAKMGLPIGSGKIESTNKHLIQKRLKLPGAWWKRENAESIAELRVLRANGGWEYLWQGDFFSSAKKRVA